MFLHNRYGVLILGALTGAALNFGRLMSEAFILSKYPPWVALVVAGVGSLLFSVLLQKYDWERRKFANTATIATLGFAGTIAALAAGSGFADMQALLWYFLIIVSTALHRWFAVEMIVRHVNPAHRESYFAFQGTAMEIGTILALTGSKTLRSNMEPNEAMLVTGIIYVLLAVYFALQFGPAANLEIKYEEGKATSPGLAERSKEIVKPFVGIFIVLSAFLGLLKATESYLTTVVLKEELQSYQAIRDVMTDYYIIAAGLTIAVSLSVGWLLRQKHVSPIILMTTYLGVMLVFLCGAAVFGELEAFLALSMARRVFEGCLFAPSMQITFNSMAGASKKLLRTLRELFYFTVPGLPLTLVLGLISSLYAESHRTILMMMLLGFIIGALVSMKVFRSRWVKVLYQFVEKGRRAESVAAVQTLSYLKPIDYQKRMSNLLDEKPSDVLRKTIILGLGNLDEQESTEVIFEQFHSEREEIQIAVLDALQTSTRYESIQFLANIMMARERSQTLRVRMNAAKMIAALYGRRAIPFLLNGLRDEDERIVANTLEVLSVFKDPSLIRYFRERVESPTPRVMANALMGLAGYRSQRQLYLDVVSEVLKGFDPNLLVSVLYVIGNLKDRSFMNDLKALADSERSQDEAVKRGLASAFTCLDDTQGFDLFFDLFAAPFDTSQKEPYIHFFAQLDRGLRFDLLKYFAIRQRDNQSFMSNLIRKLTNSHFDFHEELQYLNILMASVEAQKSVGQAA